VYKKIYIIAAFFLCIDTFPVIAQGNEVVTTRQTSNSGGDLNASSLEASQNIMLARSSADYRVTPGDVYTLSYAAGSTQVSYTIAVDASYRIRVSNLGIVNGTGKTFMQLKSEVETIVSNNYPLSGVQLVLTQPAIFKVLINGEVHKAGEVNAWGLSRLSSLIDEKLTEYASIRDISIMSANEQTVVYDLFKAQRMGDMSQDPYLRPGDIITFNRINRIVTINGEVERPGKYQILEGENLKNLIEFYANGLTFLADLSKIELVRLVNSADIAGDTIYLTEGELADNYELELYDRITIPSITQLRPVIFVEGAAASTWQALDDMGQETTEMAQDLTSSNRLVVQFNKGETYASLVRRNINWFTAVSDTQNAYILRNNQRVPINLNPMLYNDAYRNDVRINDILVQENDVLVIPFRQYFVTVAGAVANPGRYPYIPDRNWEYYIGLAGGFVAALNVFDSVIIRDAGGVQLKKTDAILPETTITAKSNHSLYYFNQYAPVITTVLTIITTLFSILMYSR